MSYTIPDILPGLIDALEGSATIAADLPAYNSAKAVHTRRPAPADTPKPYALVGPYVTVDDRLDTLNKGRFDIVLDISFYGDQSDSTEYRKVERLARNTFGLFHRQPSALTVSGYQVVQIICSGPTPAPADDDAIVGRLVTLTVTVQAS